MTTVSVDVLTTANTRLLQALINKLVSTGALSKESLAEMVNEIIAFDRSSGEPKAAEIEAVLKQMFVRG